MKESAPGIRKKLALHKETIRILTDRELIRVEGGGGNRQSCGHPASTCAITRPPCHTTAVTTCHTG